MGKDKVAGGGINPSRLGVVEGVKIQELGRKSRKKRRLRLI